MNLAQLAITAALVALWVGVLLRRDHFVVPPILSPTIKLTHILPAILQIVLFTYWAMYSQNVIAHLPVIGLQLVIAYAFDFLFAWTLRRPYHPSFGPVPIVLSMNLFVWFREGDVLLYVLAIAIAFSSKSLLQAAGRHIFNPSVLGVATVGVLCIVLPGVFRYQDISHDFSSPPHMAEVIVLLALIPQIRLRTAPVALGTAVAMFATMLIVFFVTGYQGGPSPWWPPWLLAITLLAGDPATIPSDSAGRLLFGLFLGVAFYVVSRGLLFSVGTDFFSKVLPIPIANLLVPAFERAGARLSARWPSFSRPTGNRACVAVWLSLSVLILFVGHRP
jgi:hypothetical protein